MGVEQLLSWVSAYGYWALFFCLWLGIVGLPIPDEVIVMTSGLTSSLNLLKPIPAFLLIYVGVISGLTLGYIIGRALGVTVLDRLFHKEKWQKYRKRSEQLIQRYGSYALCLGYFLPIIRHLLPYLVGIHRMPYYQYALFSYTAGLVWTGLFYWLGYQFGHSIDFIAQIIQKWGMIALGIIMLLAILFSFVPKTQIKKEAKKG
ncbi:DedA family protein [Thermoflavimicrobium dichotomicum]|uniref:Membrane protein DedA, SNARE-associated domain n=1 Tax=Thermoflavimicrobium dichotomicum TaxID=46223 RepID=A0A1I3P396_9BACL|nr:DedA family protein [Thermoflavimicrobium dichotomicum]SFJ15899.1 membrane protein DedA, SNARE-associated domain [Thermoflavimicrobium dichotomicum]